MKLHQKYITTSTGLFFLLFSQHVFAQQSNTIAFPERGFVSLKAAPQWEQALVSGNGKHNIVLQEKQKVSILIGLK